MAGIGFTLRRLTEQDNLIGVVQGYVYAGIVTAGPWLFTIAALGLINVVALQFLGLDRLILFRLLVIYTFSFSLVLTAPVVIASTRYLSDLIYRKEVEAAPGVLMGSLCLALATQMPLVIWFFGFFVDLTPLERLAAICTYGLITGVWVVSVFLTAIKDYRTVSLAFGVGMAVALLAGTALMPWFGVAGLLLGFDAGLAVILFALMARVLSEYPYPPDRPWAFLPYFRRYWDLCLAALIGNLALWIDKWVMWFSPEAVILAGQMRFYPLYDSGMFLAYLTMLPAMALFILQIETGFFQRYQSFFSTIQGHATLGRIQEAHQALVMVLFSGMRNMLVLQGALATLMVLTAPRLFDLLGSGYQTLGIFRFGVIGSLFQVMIMFLITILSYFDLRRVNLMIQILFLILNGSCAVISLMAGPATYGLGFVVAAGVTTVIAYTIVTERLMQLPYLTFVGNNPSVRDD